MSSQIVNREIDAMGLTREWADRVRDMVHRFEAYPRILTYTLDLEQENAIYAIGPEYWQSFKKELAPALRNRVSLEDFSKEKVAWFCVGTRDIESNIDALSKIYSDIDERVNGPDGFLFPYACRADASTRVITFDKISSLEVIEYALQQCNSGRDRQRDDVFSISETSKRQIYSLHPNCNWRLN